MVPALAQFYVARVKYLRWPAATAPAISHTITSSPIERMMNRLVSVAVGCGGSREVFVVWHIMCRRARPARVVCVAD